MVLLRTSSSSKWNKAYSQSADSAISRSNLAETSSLILPSNRRATPYRSIRPLQRRGWPLDLFWLVGSGTVIDFSEKKGEIRTGASMVETGQNNERPKENWRINESNLCRKTMKRGRKDVEIEHTTREI